MKKPIISIIAAIGENRGIGKDNKLLWHIPQDLERFKKLTFSHPVIMGRITFESIGKALPGRTNIIVTRDKNYEIEGCLVTHSFQGAIDKAKKEENDEIFIIGGEQIYKQGIDYADKLYLTIVHDNFAADAFFPDFSQFKTVISRKEGKTDQYRYTFLELVK